MGPHVGQGAEGRGPRAEGRAAGQQARGQGQGRVRAGRALPSPGQSVGWAGAGRGGGGGDPGMITAQYCLALRLSCTAVACAGNSMRQQEASPRS